MKKVLTSVVCAAMFASSTSAFAATAQLTQSNGKVLVNMGEGFVSPMGIVDLKAGDQIMVGAESAAVVTYENGCSVNLAAGSVLAVAAKAPCAKGAAVVGETVIMPVADADDSYAVPTIPPIWLLLGGAAVVTTGTIILVNSNKKSSGP